MTTTALCIYRFGEFRLDAAARELWRGDELLELPRLTFDGLAFLVESRDRAVSRDDLISSVWGKPYVEDILVTQLIMRLRRAIGDDSHEPQFIRTVPGFGYRWIAETEEVPVEEAEPSLPAKQATRAAVSTAAPWFLRWRLVASSAIAAVALIGTFIYLGTRSGQIASPLPRELGAGVAVLPLEVTAAETADASWVRLGAMDLIAGRLRDAGLPVPPSDSVIAALHAVAERPEAERLTALRRTLGAGVLVQGEAKLASDGWTIELTATAADSELRRIASEVAEIIPAAGQASELLLAALGRTAPTSDLGDDEALSELLQRARAATLALELDTARAILNDAPEPLRDDPEVRHQLVWIEFYAGRRDEAARLADKLLATPAVTASPRLHAKVLRLRGAVAAFEQEDWSVGKPYLDAAVAALDGELWGPELGAALALRGVAHAYLHEFDAAARDLGRARTLYEVAGNRLGLAGIHNNFANLELQRKRPADALPHFRKALEIHRSFGHVNGLRTDLLGTLVAQMQLLRWPEALATSERLLALRERIRDPVPRHFVDVAHAAVLVALGRHREAEAILDALRQDEVDGTPFAARRSEEVRAELAWQWGHPERALHAAARVLELWAGSRASFAETPVELALLYQRASIVVGRPVPAARALSAASMAAASQETGTGAQVGEPGDQPTIVEDPAYLVAEAEWAAHGGSDARAERLFRQAAARAEEWAVPDTLVLVADAYVRWLLAHDRVAEALALAGRVAGWAEHDYESALLQVAVLHAAGQREAWAKALRRARKLVGEREIPSELLSPPV